MSAQSTANPADIIDLDVYPLDGRDPDRYDAAVATAREQVTTDGCCVLPGFVSASALLALVSEADDVAGHAHRSFNRTNAYFSEDDPGLHARDPRRRFYDRSNAFVPADHFGPIAGFARSMNLRPFRPSYAPRFVPLISTVTPTRLPM